MRCSWLIVLCAACGVGDSPDGGGGGGGAAGGSGSGSGSGSGGGGGDGTGMTATKFLDDMGHKYCDQAFMCKASFPTDEGVTFEQAFGASASACYTDSLAAMEPMKVEAQITAGTIKWNAADASTCLAGMTFPACTQFWTDGPAMPAACDTALVGTIADGAACVTTIECSNLQSYCDETTKKCTVDTTGARTTPVFQQPLDTAVVR